MRELKQSRYYYGHMARSPGLCFCLFVCLSVCLRVGRTAVSFKNGWTDRDGGTDSGRLKEPREIIPRYVDQDSARVGSILGVCTAHWQALEVYAAVYAAKEIILDLRWRHAAEEEIVESLTTEDFHLMLTAMSCWVLASKSRCKESWISSFLTNQLVD